MKQTTLCVPMEVRPESCSRLSAIIEEVRHREDKEHRIPANFARVTEAMPGLHFMSLSVFASADYDPMFILEANFDGRPGPFWGQLESLLGPDLRAIVRCCKRPLDGDGPLYDAVTAPGSTAAVAAYLEARTERPSVFHHGNRGLTRGCILQEAALFDAVRAELDAVPEAGTGSYRALPPVAVHERLRARMIGAHPWLDEPAPPRIGRAERAADVARLLAFAVGLVLALSLPGFALALILPTGVYAVLVLVLAAAATAAIWWLHKPLPGTGVPTGFTLRGFAVRHAAAIGIYALVGMLGLVPAAALLALVLSFLGGLVAPLGPREAVGLVAPALFWGLFSLLAVLPLIVLWLRYLERRDSSHDAPPVDERTLREMIRREDWVAQNHMGSIVLVKPGILRTLIIRLGHLGLGLLLRVTATDGYLGTMRTVHFAHWAFLNNGSRLLFFSNFDHSWDSYLDDFIEKAHTGLTLAWGCGVGFPPTRFLIYDGASHGRRFKTWALASRAVSRFWYSAYPTLTVDQIERHHRVATGLRRARLDDGEARTWMRDL